MYTLTSDDFQDGEIPDAFTFEDSLMTLEVTARNETSFIPYTLNNYLCPGTPHFVGETVNVVG